MRKSIKKNIAIIALLTVMTFSACDREPIPPPQPVVEQISIADLKALYKGTTVLLDTSLYIQGIVTLTPEKNNIPDFIGYMQDETGGITLTVDGNNTLAEGSEIKIMCSGLELSEYNGLLQFGNVDLASQSELINLVADPVTPATATLAEIINGDFVAELVSVSGVEFEQKGTFSGGKNLSNCSEMVEVYTRSEATFSADAMPEGNGTFVGVVSTYFDPQLILRDPSELDMEGERCNPFFEGIFSEDFQSLSDYDPISDLTTWSIRMEEGDRDWIARVYSGNVYAQTTAFNSGLASMKTWMITPSIDLSSAGSPILTFDTKTGYVNGATLDVMISTDYDGSASPWNFNWTDLNPTLADGPSNGYSDWVASGNIDLSSYNSAVYIAFVYTGSDGATKKTTTWQVDNIIIEESSK